MSESLIYNEQPIYEAKPQIRLLIPDRIKETDYFNFTGLSMQELLRFFPSDLKAKKIVLLPDFTPNKSGLLPSGCSVEIDTSADPEWRRFAVSDVGCGMQVLKSSLEWEDFENNKDRWDFMYERLLDNKGQFGDLGSGNHFLDAAVDADERLYFVIHTGSRDESEKATDLIDNPEAFDAVYTASVEWARQNRDEIGKELTSEYGELEFVLDKPHNFYLKDDIRGKATIYKGAVILKPGELNIVPSSMDGDMALIQASEDLRQINYSMLHGTGRVKSRSESKEDAQGYDFNGLRSRIYIPLEISDASILTENPTCYRNLDDCLELVHSTVTVNSRLTPIGYIGQL